MRAFDRRIARLSAAIGLGVMGYESHTLLPASGGCSDALAKKVTVRSQQGQDEVRTTENHLTITT